MKNKSLFLCFFLVCTFWMTAQELEKPIVLVIGTRPEVIKIMPIYYALKDANLPVLLCSTGQHMELVDEVLSVFNVKLDYNFAIMKPKQDLVYITTSVLEKTTDFFKTIQPSLVVVQGDTTTAMAAALASFYCKIPVAHVEAGLRTQNIYAPFPEEMNRQIISKIASLHFSPTAESSLQLESEGISKDKIFHTGNTIVDSLIFIKNQIETGKIEPSLHIKESINELKDNGQSILLFTIHRRESLDTGIEEVMLTLHEYLSTHPSVSVLYPAHPNPLIRDCIKKTKLDALPNLILLDPLPYNDLIYILLNSKGVLTDSGGIQEEAISLNKFTLVLRNETDRPEGLKTGCSLLVGTERERVWRGIEKIFTYDKQKVTQVDSLSVDCSHSMQVEENREQILQQEHQIIHSPYGDGLASNRIVEIIKNFLNL